MRTVYLLFIFLCLLSSGKHTYAYAGTHHHANNSSSAHNIGKSKENKFVNSKSKTLFKSSASTDKEEFLIGYEDDDENTVSARKYILTDKFSLILFYTFVLGYLSTCINNRLPICSHLFFISSNRYIVQRALRI